MVQADARLGADRVPVGGRDSCSGQQETAAAFRSVWAQSMAVTREDFWAVGRSGTGFGKLGTHVSRPEDTDLCSRLTDALKGRASSHGSLARIGHRVPAEQCALRYFRWRCSSEGKGKRRWRPSCGRAKGCAMSGTTPAERCRQGLP